MSDIFISYSRKDSEQALQLSELLTWAGMSCWIDTKGIDVATSWSGEIVDAIDNCKAFIILLSSSSAASHNVAKELSLASERQKKILPLDLEPIELPREFAYQLAGIQRSPMTNIDAIIRALGKLGLQPAASSRNIKPAVSLDHRKSVMVLPFEDLSPGGDNGWFTDGMASELTLALTKIGRLRVIDWNTSRLFRERKVKTAELAKELQVRYFIEGQVRKFGDQIKIATTLLDIESGDHLWQDSMKGTMNDVFAIQERVALEVVSGLKLHLDAQERSELETRGTTNAEAYELYLRAAQYLRRGTSQADLTALELLSTAIELDPDYSLAYRMKASTLQQHYQHYERNPALLTEAEQLALHSLILKPDLWSVYGTLSSIYRAQGKMNDAEAAAIRFTERAPKDPASHSQLGYFYQTTGRPALAIQHFERAAELSSESLAVFANLIFNYEAIGDSESAARWARIALPLYERHLRLLPDDEGIRVMSAHIQFSSGSPERASETLAAVLKKPHLDGRSIYNIACLYARLGESDNALDSLERALECGYSGIEAAPTDPDLRSLRSLPRFNDLLARIESSNV